MSSVAAGYDVQAVPFGELTSDSLDHWAKLRDGNPQLVSPYFHPAYFQALHAAGRPFEVALFRDAGKVVGYLPFERRRFNLARPAGWPMSDYQGAITEPGREPDLGLAARALGLRALDFDHLIEGQVPRGAGSWERGSSPVIDLSQGYEAYVASRESGTDLIRDTDRKLRKVEREIGPVRLVWHTADPAVLEQLITWKSAQYKRTAVVDLFATPWPGEFLHRLLEQDRPEFGAVLTVMYFGDRVAAIHLGLRSHRTLHSWFPAYDESFYKFSPGTSLMVLMIREAQTQGVDYIDLGKGTESYKERFASHGVPLASGSIVLSRPVRALRVGWSRTRGWIRASPIRPALEPLIASARRLRESIALR